jgi:hypothetical protein
MRSSVGACGLLGQRAIFAMGVDLGTGLCADRRLSASRPNTLSVRRSAQLAPSGPAW